MRKKDFYDSSTESDTETYASTDSLSYTSTEYSEYSSDSGKDSTDEMIDQFIKHEELLDKTKCCLICFKHKPLYKKSRKCIDCYKEYCRDIYAKKKLAKKV